MSQIEISVYIPSMVFSKNGAGNNETGNKGTNGKVGKNGTFLIGIRVLGEVGCLG